ncbi:hypothetical protein NCAS_0D01900 [Naumovozyma castellii]|uniref:DNA-directed RNA polymerase III subunit RPC9 n=1 Tax=Naumovozyma castellii TaxID=27288 RepID=G0VDY1_NAUCA|nr:hypothetical protein NCAS_0D01900 [Naumovozyma castellii CBS 4309]CCC69771.1 hypothetical protein NCAS_0D01900 [Naumovozyma castellii CBS 4309]
MKVIEPRDAFLSDYEVLQFLSKLERRHHWDDETTLANQKNKKMKKKIKRPYNHAELQNITRNTINYLSMNKNFIQQGEDDVDDPQEAKVVNESNIKSAICNLNDERFTEFMQRLNEFDLFKVEKLQIVNDFPTNMVHLYSIIEECDSRFNEEQIEQILSIVKSFS